MSLNNLYKYQKWIKDYSNLNKEIINHSLLNSLKADYYRFRIKELKKVYSKDFQSRKLNLLELMVCSKESI